jgi:hypothetical protein
MRFGGCRLDWSSVLTRLGYAICRHRLLQICSCVLRLASNFSQDTIRVLRRRMRWRNGAKGGFRRTCTLCPHRLSTKDVQRSSVWPVQGRAASPYSTDSVRSDNRRKSCRIWTGRSCETATAADTGRLGDRHCATTAAAAAMSTTYPAACRTRWRDTRLSGKPTNLTGADCAHLADSGCSRRWSPSSQPKGCHARIYRLPTRRRRNPPYVKEQPGSSPCVCFAFRSRQRAPGAACQEKS